MFDEDLENNYNGEEKDPFSKAKLVYIYYSTNLLHGV